jgi:AraC-like DNA-binding protein
MLFEFNFFSAILLVFFVHITIYSVLILKKYVQEQSQSALWLALFLLIAALYITPWMVGFGGWYSKQPYRDILFYTPFQQLYLIGPVIYFYVQSQLSPVFTLKKASLWHFTPALLYLSFCIVMVVTDKLVLNKYYFLADGQDRDFDLWYQLTGFASMVYYFVKSLQHYQKYRKAIYSVLSNAADVDFNWVNSFLKAFLAIILVRFTFFIVGQVIKEDYNDTWWYFLAFAIICYYISINGYANSIKSKVIVANNEHGRLDDVFELSNHYNENDQALKQLTEETIHESSNEDYTEWTKKITELVEKEKLYEIPELTLFDVAKKLNTNVSLLSKIINKGFGSNFNDYINTYRVNAVVAQIKAEAHVKNTILSIAYDCGFNSKSTFNRSFKKQIGVSPQEFIKNQVN